jgi:glycosyltransferase involved in cell wall biosynthesis
MMSYRLYGPKSGNSSWPRVAAGVAEGLASAGVKFSWYDTSSLLDDGDALVDGWDADIGLYVGPPSECGVLSARGRHKHRLAMVAANSSWLPPEIMRFMNKIVTGYLAPSRWARDVLLKYSDKLPVFLFKHGVSNQFKPDPNYVDRMRFQGFRVAHFASTTMQRKGTSELIQAWYHLKALAPTVFDDSATLDLYVEGSHGYAKKEIDQAVKKYGASVCDVASVRVLDPVNLPNESMVDLYQAYHVICQPSRSEGFGLVPLEALCCGVPVVVSYGTGHKEYLIQDLPGAVQVQLLGEALIDDGPGAMAPGIDFYDLARELTTARQKWQWLSEQAFWNTQELRTVWSWKAVTLEFVDRLEQWIASCLS